jgi:hypothetical protein
MEFATMTGIDWMRLGEEASQKRAALWDTMIRTIELEGSDVPEVAPKIRDAYVNLRIDYETSRTLLLSGRAPLPEDLDPAMTRSPSQITAFKDRVLTFIAQVEAACFEAEGSPDDAELAQRMATQLMQSGRACDPLT